MQGPPLRLAPIGQGAFGHVHPKDEEYEEVWEVPLNPFNRPAPGNQVNLSNQRNLSWANKPPSTPRAQPIRHRIPKTPKKYNRTPFNILNTPSTPIGQPIRKQIPKTPKKDNGFRRKARKSRRRNRKY